MRTKEDRIREVDQKLVWCSQVIDDDKSLNQIQKIQNNIQYYSNKQLGELLDALEEFNADRPDTFQKVLLVAGNIEMLTIMQNNQNLKYKANNRKLPVVLEPEEVARLLSIPNKRFISGLRNKAMLRLMLSMGLRVSEVVNLKPSDLNLTLRKLRIVNGKGGVDRDIIIPEFIIDLLKEWKDRKPNGTSYFFTTYSGSKLSRIYIYNMVRNYTKRAGIDKSVSPHTLRHTFGTNFYRQTKDIETLRKILGHAHIGTTQIYVTLANIDIEKAMNSFKDYTVL